jgi:hypothetical protein
LLEEKQAFESHIAESSVGRSDKISDESKNK